MSPFFECFVVAVIILPVFWCSLSIGGNDFNSFLFEDGKLTANCFNKDSSQCLSQLASYKSVSKLHLEGFVFDEVNIEQFSETICELQELTLNQCDINDELASLLTLPPCLKSIRLTKLNLSLEGIQSIADKLHSSLESLELVKCLSDELSLENQSIDSSIQCVWLDISKFSYLKTICIDNLDDDFESYDLLLSLSPRPLEKIKLSRVYLSTEEWTLLLDEWKGTNRIAFSNTLKEFDLEIESISENHFIRLIQFLFSIPSLEIVSLYSSSSLEKASLPPLPPNIKQFTLFSFEKVFMEDGKTSFYNSKNLSHLTHLTIAESFDVFPHDLFKLNQLEHLVICDFTDDNYPTNNYLSCGKLKYLFIRSDYLIPLLVDFEENFPVIETLDISSTQSANFDLYLETIISSKTLKSLKIDYDDNDKHHSLKIRKTISSSIEKLKLWDVWWKFVSDLLEVERFPRLKKIHIGTKDLDLDLGKVLEKLSSFPQLTSITLVGKLSLSNEKLPFSFEKLKFFYLGSFQKALDLDLLLSSMPNLIELKLGESYLSELKLQNPVGIRYLELPYDFLENNGDFVNVIKNAPNLIHLRTHSYYRIQSVPFATELAYYFKELKKHFNNELQFEVNPNCFPIQQLKNDFVLFALVRLKSSELPAYLKNIFPFDSSESFFERFFTIGFTEYFDAESIDGTLIVIFFHLLSELEIDNEEDILFVKNLVFDGENDSFTEPTECYIDTFYKLFSNSLTKDIGINLESVHLEFVKNFFIANKKYGLPKIYNFLKSFFTSLSVDEESLTIFDFFESIFTSPPEGRSKIISKEMFDYFSSHLLAPSFRLLLDKIKKGELNEREKKILYFDYNSLADELKNLEQEQYEELSFHFRDALVELSGESFVKSLFDILKAILVSNTKCCICIDSLFVEKIVFFKSIDGNCHLFHSDCLNRWLQDNTTCPQCRRAVSWDE